MGGLFQNCCCGPAVNCEVRILAASKNRNGFPVLYIASGINKLRFLTKAIDFSGYSTLGVYYDYHATLDITERKNGLLATSESSSLPGGSTLATNRTFAIAEINSTFGTYKTSANGDYSVGPVQMVTLDWTYDGSDIIGAHFRRWLNRFPGDNETVYEWWVALSNEYTDTMLTDDVDELRAEDAGGGAGLDGVADNTLMVIAWNENEINAALGTTCANDPSSLASYTTTTGPSLVTTVYDPATYFAGSGIWWQHAGGSGSNGEILIGDPDGPPYDDPFSVYHCTFDGDTTMPHYGGGSSNWSVEVCHAIRFNLAHSICCEYTTVDTTSTSVTDCIISTVSTDHVDFTEPHPTAASNKNVTSFYSWTFTAPGYLTGGGCPCSNTP